MPIEEAAAWIRQADGLLITAGAGMGIDSGLPDFRGPGGFWGVYPALGRARIAFEAIANPAAFERNPALAWGFYGHRLALYRQTKPHAGFAMLQALAEKLERGAFVFTSNVDGHFRKAGFAAERICEVHGSIHHLQCAAACSDEIWSADSFQPEVDSENCRLMGDPPLCPRCGQLARPNILMFGDWQWLERRSALQQQNLQRWLATVDRLVTLEIGAGTQVATVRHFSERQPGRLIRLNPDEPEIARHPDALALPLGALAGLEQLHQALA